MNVKSDNPSLARIALLSVALAMLCGIGLFASLPSTDRPERPLSSTSHSGPKGQDEQAVYVPGAEFSAANDPSVLKAALAGYCERPDGYYVVSDVPIDRMDNRMRDAPRKVPAAVECDRLRLAAGTEINTLFEAPRSESEMPLSSAWNSFYDRYPGAKGLVSISMPLYFDGGSKASVYIDGTCGALCGAGWNILLRKENGKWVIEKRVPRWIS